MVIRDGVGPNSIRAIWQFYGPFPLQEIIRGRRACRRNWRDRVVGSDREFKEGIDMLAVVVGDDSSLLLERESAEYIEGYESFNSTEDLSALDWYVEKK